MKDLNNDIQYILTNLEIVKKIKKAAFSLRKQLIDLTLEETISEIEFYKITSLLSPQSRSVLWQNYYNKKNNCTKVSVQENKGDFMVEGEYYEYKASGFNSNNTLNIVQIREWQNCSYVIQSIQSTGQVFTFRLTKNEMQQEVIICKATSAHGTKSSNVENQNIEKRITLKITDDNESWRRWKSKYLIS